jgi:inhibitor of cysteine peptidase
MDQIILTKSDNGARLTLAPGKAVLIRLPENPTTGFRWQAASGTIVDTDRFIAAGSETAGAAGERLFTFTASATAMTLHFTLARSWETDSPAEEFTCHTVPEV